MIAELVIDHNAGFFSCCSVRLTQIVDFFNDKKRLPVKIDTSAQFYSYKNNSSDDIDQEFFKSDLITTIKSNTSVRHHWDYQFLPYGDLDFNGVYPFIKKYFTPSVKVQTRIKEIEQKYNIEYDNTIAVLYRGNDKQTETKIASYDIFVQKAIELQRKYNNATFLVQTDEIEFHEYFSKHINNSVVLQELPMMHKNTSRVIHTFLNIADRVLFGINLVAIINIISKCSHIITHSGNCGIWCILYRNSVKNVHQYLNSRGSTTDNWVTYT
jgi:hypothetical protein